MRFLKLFLLIFLFLFVPNWVSLFAKVNSREISAKNPENKKKETPKVKVYAKEILFNLKTGIIKTQGKVQIVGPFFKIHSSKAIYYPEARVRLYNYTFFDEKNLIFIQGNQVLFDLRNFKIKGDEAFIWFQRRGLYVKAKNFRRNALNEYFAKKVIFTTCNTTFCRKNPPSWSIEVKNFYQNKEGTTRGEASIFKVHKVPLFVLPKIPYLPKPAFPVTLPRKRGFLFPVFGFGTKNKFFFQIPYFFPVNDQLDFTFAPMYLSENNPLFDFENAFTYTSNLNLLWKLRFLKDRKQEEKNRWWTTGKFSWKISPETTLNLDWDRASDKSFVNFLDVGENGFSKSDRVYTQRFGRPLDPYSQEYRSSQFWVLNQHENQIVSLSVKDYQYFGKNEPQIFTKQGKISLALLPLPVFNDFLVSGEGTLAYFYRKENYTGQKANLDLGLFSHKNLFGLKNAFNLGFHFREYALTEKGNLNQTFYTTGFLTFQEKTYLYLRKKYSLVSHKVKPFFSLFYRSSPWEKEFPYFEYEDTVQEKNLFLKYGFSNYLDNLNGTNYFYSKVYQKFFIAGKEKGRFSSVYSENTLRFPPHFSLDYRTSFNVYNKTFETHHLGVSFFDLFSLKNVLSLSYDFNRKENSESGSISISQRFGNYTWLGYNLSKNLKTGETTSETFSIKREKDCYLIVIGMRKSSEETVYFFVIQLKGIGSYSREFKKP